VPESAETGAAVGRDHDAAQGARLSLTTASPSYSTSVSVLPNPASPPAPSLSAAETPATRRPRDRRPSPVVGASYVRPENPTAVAIRSTRRATDPHRERHKWPAAPGRLQHRTGTPTTPTPLGPQRPLRPASSPTAAIPPPFPAFRPAVRPAVLTEGGMAHSDTADEGYLFRMSGSALDAPLIPVVSSPSMLQRDRREERRKERDRRLHRPQPDSKCAECDDEIGHHGSAPKRASAVSASTAPTLVSWSSSPAADPALTRRATKYRRCGRGRRVEPFAQAYERQGILVTRGRGQAEAECLG